jgi:D-alanyl-D-alanine dipeptidase
VYDAPVGAFFIGLLLLFAVEQGPAPASTPALSATDGGPRIVADLATYRAFVRLDHQRAMVDLERFVPGLRLDLAYAQDDNVTGRRLYDVARAYLRIPAARALRAAQRELAARGLGLLVWDAYRPYAATLALWEVVGDSRYAASPTYGSVHNRGCAVDVTLVEADGDELRMPTAYDEFTVKAHADYPDLPAAVRRRRALLRGVMERHGFTALSTEWWHFEYRDGELPEPMDLDPGQLGAVPLPAEVWASYPFAGRLAATAELFEAVAR